MTRELPRGGELAPHDDWDAVVIGAGPAGALAARQAACAGLRTLLVDAKTFPRNKVCGGCLNHLAMAALAYAGLDRVVEDLGAVRLTDALMAIGRQRTSVPLPGGLAVSRLKLDAELVRCAVEAGVTFLPGTTAQLERSNADEGRAVVSLHDFARRGRVTAGVVLVADGLLQSSLKAWPECHAQIQPATHVGLGVWLPAAPDDYPPSRITMAITRHGYVGLTRVEDGGLNIAAAVSPPWLRSCGQAGELVRAVLDETGLPVPEGLVDGDWHGTPPLTRKVSRIAGPRFFLLGDTSGYIEPFTGEGMAWAMHSALAVVPLAVRACQGWDDALAAEWEQTHRELIQSRQDVCRFLAGLARRPWASSIALRICRWVPGLAESAVARINRAPPGHPFLAAESP